MVDSLNIQIGLEGDAEVKAKVDGIAKSFDQATRSIAGLGTTGTEALANAAAAAQKLGASQQDLQKVESIINALNARARDSGKSFTELATAYDKARASTAQLAVATTKAEEGLSAMARTGAVIGTAMSGVASAVSAAAVAIGVASVAAMIKFVNAAEDSEKALTKLQAVSGQTFKNLSSLSIVFSRGGTALKQFASEFGNLSEKIASAGEAAAKQDAIKKQAEDAAKGLKVTELGAITLDERVKVLLQDLSSASPEQQWLRLADIFKNLGNTVERARIGQALGLSPESIATLSQGSEAIKKLQADAERLGLTLTDSNQQALQQMAQGWNEFTTLLSALFQKIGAAAAPAFAKLYTAFSEVMQAIAADFANLPLDQALANLGTRLKPAFEAIVQLLEPVMRQIGALLLELAGKVGAEVGVALGKAIIQGLVSVLTFNVVASIFKAAMAQLGISGAGAAPSGGAPGMAAGGLLGGSGTGTSDSNLAWVSRGEHIMPASVVRQPGVLAFLEALRQGGNIPGFAGGGRVGGSSTDIFSEALMRKFPFGDTKEDINRIDQNVIGIGQEIVALQSYIGATNEDCKRHSDAIAEKVEQSTDIFAEALLRVMPFGDHASGGLLGGRGTGTSDSNLAWVSRGEYITPARAVGQPGVLGFLEALRRSGGSLSAALNGMGRFALGGLVRGSMPAFAAGGLAGGSHVTIQFPGLPAIGGLRASSDVVDQLHRAAALAQVRSGGRKPSRYS